MILKKNLFNRYFKNIFRLSNFKYFSILNNQNQNINDIKNLNDFYEHFNDNKDNIDYNNSIFLLNGLINVLNLKNRLDNNEMILFFLNIIDENIEKYEFYEILEILNLYRKLYELKFHNLNPESITFLHDKTKNHSDWNLFGINMLIDLLYNLSVLKLNADFIGKIILEFLEKNKEFELNNRYFYKIISSFSFQNGKTKNIINLVNYIIYKNIKNSENFNLNFKIKILNEISKINVNNILFINNIQEFCKSFTNYIVDNNLNDLDQRNILDIIELFSTLPTVFNFNLLVKVRELVFKNLNIDHNFYNKNFVLFYYLKNKKFINFKLLIKFNLQLIKILYKQFKNNEIEDKYILSIFDLYSDYHLLPELFHEAFNKIIINFDEIQINIKYFYIFSDLKFDFKEWSERFLIKNENHNSYNFFKFIIYDILNPNNDDPHDWNIDLKNKFQMTLLLNHKNLRKDIIFEILNKFDEEKDGLSNYLKFYYVLNISNLKNYNKSLVKKLKEVFDFKINSFSNHNYILETIKNIDKTTPNYFIMLIHYYHQNNHLLNYNNLLELLMVNSSYLFKIYGVNYKLIFYIFDIFKKQIDDNILTNFRLFYLFIRQLLNFGINEIQISYLFMKLLEGHINNPNINLTFTNKLFMFKFFNKYELIDKKIIIYYYQEIKDSLENINNNYIENIFLKYYEIYYYSNNKIGASVENKANEIFNVLVENYNFNDPEIVLNGVIGLLKFPFDKIKNFDIFERLKENIGFINTKLYLKIFESVSKANFLKNQKFYLNIFEYLLDNINLLKINLTKNEYLFISFKIYVFNFYNEPFFQIIKDAINANKINLKYFDLHQLLKRFFYINYYDKDSIEMILGKNLNETLVLKIIYLVIQNVKIKSNNIEELIEKDSINDQFFCNYIIYKFLNTENIEQNKDFLLKHFENLLKKVKLKKNQYNFEFPVFYYTMNILKIIENNSKLSDYLKSKFSFKKKNKNKSNTIDLYFSNHDNEIKSVILFLNKNQIKNIKNPLIKGQKQCGILLTQKNIFLDVWNKNDLFRNVYKFTSKTEWKKKYLNLLDKNMRVVNLNFEEFDNSYNKINYLDIILK